MAVCGIATVYDAMSEDDKRALFALLCSPLSANAVAKELQAAGFKTSYQTVYRHRTQTCSCEGL